MMTLLAALAWGLGLPATVIGVPWALPMATALALLLRAEGFGASLACLGVAFAVEGVGHLPVVRRARPVVLSALALGSGLLALSVLLGPILGGLDFAWAVRGEGALGGKLRQALVWYGGALGLRAVAALGLAIATLTLPGRP
jgi:hypothetical protein